MTRDAVGSPTAKPHDWIALAVICLPCAAYAIDRTVLNLALPRISAELHPTGPQLLWMLDIYVFVLAGLLIPMGALGDRIGRRRLLLIGAVIFSAASAFASIAVDASTLIAARALQGLGGAALAPSTLSLIRHMFLNPSERTFAIGVWAASHSVGGALGPLLGGVLLESFTWRSVFWIGPAAMSVVLLVGPSLLPEFRARAIPRMNLLGASQSLAAILLIVFGLKVLMADGWQWSGALTLVLGLAILPSFVRRQRNEANPLLDVALFRDRKFTGAFLAYTSGCFVATGMAYFTAQYLQLVLGFSPLKAGLYTIPASAGFVLGSMLAPAIGRQLAPANVMSIGLLVGASGLWLIGRIHVSTEIFAAGLFFLSFGLAVAFIEAIGRMVGSAPPDRAGEVSALSETGSELGAALGIAVLGSLGAAAYRASIEDKVPDGVAEAAAQAARLTLAGAVEVADRLPADLGAPLLHSARDAFDRSYHLAVMVSSIILITVALYVRARSHSKLRL